MTAQNHAITGALIGLAIGNPAIALPLAFLSHFALDAIPHYNPPGDTIQEQINTRRFIYEFLIGGAALCLLIVLLLAYNQPQNWLTAAICAFLAASPDLFWIPYYVSVRRGRNDENFKFWFLRFHDWIQWKEDRKFWWVEVLWFVVYGGLFLACL